MVNGFNTIFGPENPIYGGIAGDDLKFEGGKIFTQHTVYNSGIVSIIFDQKYVQLSGDSFSGWDSLGKEHTITKCHENIIYEIDHKPALELFMTYFEGVEFKPVLIENNVINTPSIYPLKFDNPDYEILRAILNYNRKDNALVLAGEVEEGTTFRFCPTPSFDVIDTTVKNFQIKNQNALMPTAMILNNCICRDIAFGPMMNDEIEGIYNIFSVPLIGFMTYGEIGPVSPNRACNFHNATSSVVYLYIKD
jgi:hypothetical protein